MADEPRRKKPRGPYKTYLMYPDQDVPASTLRSAQRGHDPTDSRPSTSTNILPQPPSLEQDRDGSSPAMDQQDRDDSSPAVDQQDRDDSSPAVDQEQSSDNEQDTQEGATVDENIDERQRATTQRSSQKTIDRHNLNEKLHKDFSCSRLDTLLMILHLAYRHCNTQAFIEDQIKFVNHLFDGNVLDVSYYIYQGVFQSSASMVRHFYCRECEVYLGSQKDVPIDAKTVKCPQCEKDIDVDSVDSGNYFVTISLKEQIECMLSRSDVRLVDKEDGRVAGELHDIFDGSIYKCCSRSECPFANKDALTVTFNTDGVKVFESTKNSLWPIQLHLNELIPEQRFKTENLILGGLWFGRTAPNMALFLKPFLRELYELSEQGVNLVKSNGDTVVCPVFATMLSVDSVAKCKILFQKQFNGMHSCLYCYHPNDTTLPTESGEETQSARLLRFFETSVTYPLRTSEEVVRDMVEADRLRREKRLKPGETINGFFGISILLIFAKYLKTCSCNTFNFVWGVAIDYMHCLLEGVMRKLVELLDTVLSKEQLAKLSDRLLKISPARDSMTRKPRSFTDHPHWKAKEYRAFLLYYALPCLEDLLPPPLFSNLKLFCRASYLLLCDKISPENLLEAENSLEKFVVGYQKLYGLKNVTYNLHLLTHLAELVRRLGPLWAYSNFVFESGNGHLLKLIRGTRSIINEMAVKFCTLQTASKVISENPVSAAALNFCREVMSVNYIGHRFSEVTVTALYSHVLVEAAEEKLLNDNNVLVNNRTVKMYHRAIRQGIGYASRSCCQDQVFNDCCVILKNGTYAFIDKIVATVDNKLMCVIKEIRIAPNYLLPNIQRCAFDFVGDVKILIPFDEVSRKCVFVEVGNKSFVCHIPNFFERD